MTSANNVTVFVIDDDARMRAAMQRLLKSVGLHAELVGLQNFLGGKVALRSHDEVSALPAVSFEGTLANPM